jgi:putative tricarboxylic transport membrane protein
MIPDTAIGPGLLPSICAVVFMLFGAALPVMSLHKARAGVRSVESEHDDTGSLGYAAILLGGLVLVILLTPYLGFIITTSLYAFAVTWVGRARWWGAALSAAVVTLLVYFLFSSLMRVPLPTGSVF